MKKAILLAALSLFLVLPAATQAFEVKSNPSVYIAKDQTVDGNLYAAGQSITIDGNVNGDVICAGQTVDISGDVAGDVICAGQVIIISGKVGGNARVAGNAIALKGEIARNTMAFGATVSLYNDATIGWDMMVGAGNLDIRGKIGGNLHGGAGATIIAGEIGKDVTLSLNSNSQEKNSMLAIEKDTKINGNLTYTDQVDANIKDGAQINGEITRNEPKSKAGKNDGKRWWAFGWGIGWVYSLLASLIVGFVLIGLWKNQVIKMTDNMLAKIKPSISWGFAIIFLTPIAIVLIMITIVGIPLALLILGSWLGAIFISKILIGIMIGRSLMEKFWTRKKDSLPLAVIFGLLTTNIIFSIPIIGWIIALIGICWGIGGAWAYYRKN
jgi:cytoskeletal protein CcmA (bactofilin family)